MLTNAPNSFSTIDLGGTVHVLHAQFHGRAFAPHWHEEYAIGLIVDGVEIFDYRGTTHRADVGQIILMDAGEVHTGEAHDERGFAFQMLYVPASSFEELAVDAVAPSSLLHFAPATMKDQALAAALRAFHRAQSIHAGGLQAESLLIESLSSVLQSAGSWRLRNKFRPTATLGRAQELLHAHLFEEVSLASLATVTGTSKYHLLRSFRKQFGLPPHAYQLQQRIFQVKRLLESGAPLADVALQCGFVDQSHLTRTFRSLVGVTPGQYAAQFSTIRNRC